MIKINDKLYTDYQIKVTWGNFEASLKNGKKNTGLAPSIIFYIDKSPIIELELTYSKEMFLKTSINNKTNITKYVSDINIKNNKEWHSLINGSYNCNIIKIKDKTFNLDFYVKENNTNIVINDFIDLC